MSVMGTSGKLQARFIFRDGQKVFFKPAGLVFLGFIRFFRVLWVLLLLALPITGFYWCLLVFSPFLNEFLDIFDFCPFELFLM